MDRNYYATSCAAPARGCAACVRQAMENANNDIQEVRRAANKVVHCKCFDLNCQKYKTFLAACKKHNIDTSDFE
jgi:hypothetical protein